MKKVLYGSLSILIMALFVMDTATAQKRSGKKQNKQMYSRNYNLNTVETVEGEIHAVVYEPSKKRKDMAGVHLMVKTDDSIIPVHLGPVWYMEQQEYTFDEGEKVTITGSRITFNDKPAIIAANVKKGEMVLQLRNQNGIPNWRGWRKGNAMNN